MEIGLHFSRHMEGYPLQTEERNQEKKKGDIFEKILEKEGNPLTQGKSFTYRGVFFQVDPLKPNHISVGDISEGQKVIKVPLSTGGTLTVNWKNINDLKTCLDLFTPEDVKNILSAISAQTRIDQVNQEIEEEESNIFKPDHQKESQR